jgi:hypothetical protein
MRDGLWRTLARSETSLSRRAGSLDGSEGSLDGSKGSLDGSEGSLDGSEMSLDGREGSLNGRETWLAGFELSFNAPCTSLNGREGRLTAATGRSPTVTAHASEPGRSASIGEPVIAPRGLVLAVRHVASNTARLAKRSRAVDPRRGERVRRQ